MTRVADVMVEVLAKAGAKRCYGVPGDTPSTAAPDRGSLSRSE
jgi:thiamine pyrophosphate-dependent acetolactate synthase large subunit-like protein